MQIYERLASHLIGTPLQRPAQNLRRALDLPRRLRHPELREIFLEEERAHQVIERAISEGDHCMDIGCHLGSVLAELTSMSKSGRHVAIEPLPYKAEWLTKKFPQVEVHQVALGPEPGEVDFYFNPKASGFSGLKVHKEDPGIQKLTVPLRRLDDVVPDDRKFSFLKIDVEGGELGLFQGATGILTEQRPVILFECTQTGLDSFDNQASQVFEALDQVDYAIYLLKDWLAGGQPLDLEGFERSMVYPFAAFNFVAASRKG
ncbi:MAG: FkbM family methyltransferase [Planctomycetota bacterium]